VEPFAGSACLFFHIAPRKALLGDVNHELIGTYRQVKKHPEEIRALLTNLWKGPRVYKHIRDEVNPAELSCVGRAARFIYLNRCCFNGIFRTNSDGKFNVPYGGDKSGRMPKKKHLIGCSELLQNARLTGGDFEKVLKNTQPGDFVYMDPPFSVKARRVFREYDKSIFSFDDVMRLRKWMQRLRKRNIAFLVSYAESEEAEYLMEGFHSEIVSVRRNIAGFTDKRTQSNEVLISYKS
jgi:DNA adenine methylase